MIAMLTTPKEGSLLASGLKLGIVVARFNAFVTDKLLEGALDAFARHGGNPADVEVARVPGAFELPLAAQRMAAGGRFDALVALGAVIRGETPHFDHVCSAATSGLARAMAETGVPIGFGLLTTDSVEQALDRAGLKGGNKGCDAMLTAIEMANLLKGLD
jgi:6,7-dimethyl-8-ribityllumazine synthase